MSDFELWQARVGDDQQNRTATITVTGELDLATAPVLREALTQCFSEPQQIVVDTRKVTFLDAVGAGVLVAAAHRAAEDGRRFIVMPSPRVERVLALVDTEQTVPLYEGDERYLSSLCQAGHHEDCIARPVVECACPCHPWGWSPTVAR